ncbi:phage holin family protein [Mycetocola zhujimingii]|uniref:Phage holin family protein n=1 Tax=Mycetocola zhujimingii TaxID=2079792 RepID=A0A2U1TD67_9MICO|nr:phage holin family protein [Mycetocola zhujimingii]AWB85276.1 phage holin family protein [Mycetocola zhujimingii]PWC06829.1 phage holin family protein [Mycetocola zhujimingii]
MTDRNLSDKSRESLFELLADLPNLITNLIQAEIEQVKTKAKHLGSYAGKGAIFMVLALIFLFFAIGTAVAVAILALALVLPAWLSALIVFVVFVLIAVILALIGLKYFKKLGDDPNPVESVKKDIRAVKGEGEYDRY